MLVLASNVDTVESDDAGAWSDFGVGHEMGLELGQWPGHASNVDTAVID